MLLSVKPDRTQMSLLVIFPAFNLYLKTAVLNLPEYSFQESQMCVQSIYCFNVFLKGKLNYFYVFLKENNYCTFSTVANAETSSSFDVIKLIRSIKCLFSSHNENVYSNCKLEIKFIYMIIFIIYI